MSCIKCVKVYLDSVLTELEHIPVKAPEGRDQLLQCFKQNTELALQIQAGNRHICEEGQA